MCHPPARPQVELSEAQNSGLSIALAHVKAVLAVQVWLQLN